MVVVERIDGLLEGGLMPTQPAGRILGEYLRKLRKDRDWSLEYVARRLDWSTTRLQYVETKQKSFLEVDELDAVAHVYGITRYHLLEVAGYTEPGAA